MELRLLNQIEHIQTREIWEEVFREDTKEFLDYYYTYMTNHNMIYVMEVEQQEDADSKQGQGKSIVSMLHLNPYEVQIAGRIFPVDYIVAVATLPQYRNQGLMRKLLVHALQQMHEKQQPITYLMPAAEAIYSPYEFVTVAQQVYYTSQQIQCSMEANSQKLEVYWKAEEITEDSPISLYTSEPQDCEQLAAFANTYLAKRYRAFTYRTPSYFEQLLHEQQAQNGGVIQILYEKKMIGYFILSNELEPVIREVCVIDEYLEVVEDYLQLVEKDTTKVMVRVTHVEKILRCVKWKSSGRKIIEVVDPLIPGNTGTYQISPNYGGMFCKKLTDSVGENPYTITELAKMVFEEHNLLLNEIV